MKRIFDTMILSLTLSGCLTAQQDVQEMKLFKNNLELYWNSYQFSYSRKWNEVLSWRIYLQPENSWSYSESEQKGKYEYERQKERLSYRIGGKMEATILYSPYRTESVDIYYGLGPAVYYSRMKSNEEDMPQNSPTVKSDYQKVSDNLSAGFQLNAGIKVKINERFFVFGEYGINSRFNFSMHDSESTQIDPFDEKNISKSESESKSWSFSDGIRCGISVAF